MVSEGLSGRHWRWMLKRHPLRQWFVLHYPPLPDGGHQVIRICDCEGHEPGGAALRGVPRVVTLAPCPTFESPVGSEEGEPCRLFEGRPCGHSWESERPNICAHADAHDPLLVPEPSDKADQPLARLWIADPQQARPPQPFGVSKNRVVPVGG